MPRNPQLDLLTPERIWQSTLLAKIKGLIDESVFAHLDRCGNEEWFKTCRECGNWEGFTYRCSLKFCPLCNWRIARQRAQLLREWALMVKQPKHVVLTMRNFPVLTRKKIRDFGRAFAKLRRNRIWRSARGGSISMEITNEGNGWHLHGHVLVDADWVNAGDLAIEWGKLVQQEFGIVKVKDARGLDYLGEVAKYVCKGAQFVSWPPEKIAEFIFAIRGIRFFRVFGTLCKMAREVRERIEAMKPGPEPCKCGCLDWAYESEASLICREAERAAPRGRR